MLHPPPPVPCATWSQDPMPTHTCSGAHKGQGGWGGKARRGSALLTLSQCKTVGGSCRSLGGSPKAKHSSVSCHRLPFIPLSVTESRLWTFQGR